MPTDLPTILKSPIIFRNMHAGCVSAFESALDNALESPDWPYTCSAVIYGWAENKEGEIFDFTEDGREVRVWGSSGEERPYWQMVCRIERDLSTLMFVCPPADGEPYWDKVIFQQGFTRGEKE